MYVQVLFFFSCNKCNNGHKKIIASVNCLSANNRHKLRKTFVNNKNIKNYLFHMNVIECDGGFPKITVIK